MTRVGGRGARPPMIVICPVCSAHYRVRDEVVPAEGAQLECARCSTRFVAQVPAPEDADWPEALAKVAQARRLAEQERDDALARGQRLERELADTRAELELSRKTLTTRITHLESDLRDREQRSAQSRARIEELEGNERVHAREIGRLREALSQAEAQAERRADESNQSTRLRSEIAELQGQLAEQRRALAALEALREEHRLAQKTAGRLATEVENAQELIGRLQIQLDQQRATAPRGDAPEALLDLRAEVERLQGALAQCEGRASPDQEIVALVASIAPMLWGLDQAIGHFEGRAQRQAPTPGGAAAREDESTGHTRHLRLVAGMLKRLTATLITH